MESTRLALFDTASLYFRAFFALPGTLRTPDDRPANAVHGLADFLARLLTATGATHAACCWDNDWRPGWRVRRVASYKTHRVADPGEAARIPPEVDLTGVRITDVAEMPEHAEEYPDALADQEPRILRMLRGAGLAVVGADHYEADDVIASLAARAPMPVSVVTGDRDLFQLIDDPRQVSVVYVAKGIAKAETLDEAAVAARYGVLPAQYADFALLRGDASDGLPGVAGIGEKTAASLLARFGDLTSLVAAARAGEGIAPGVRAKVLAALPYLETAGPVVRVRGDIGTDIGYDAFRLRAVADLAAWTSLAHDLGAGGAAARLAAALSAAAERQL